MIYIFWSSASQAEAKRIINELLNKQLIACGSIFPDIISLYHWKGKLEEATETKVILKTQAQHFSAIQEYIKTHCSYEVPEVTQVDITQANPDYLSWILQNT